LAQAQRVDVKRVDVVWTLHDETIFVLLGKGTRSSRDLVEQARNVHQFWIELKLAGLDLRQVEHLIDKLQKMLAGAVDASQRLQCLFGAKACNIAYHHLGQADNRVERRAKLVTHVGEKSRFRAVGGLGLSHGFFELFLALLEL
jgi:hypothetical protein